MGRRRAGRQGHAPRDGGHSGTSTSDDAKALAPLSGAAFDREFLTRMISHHPGGLPMAKTELDKGRNPQAKQLAQEITDTQTAEIAQMQQLLTTV